MANQILQAYGIIGAELVWRYRLAVRKKPKRIASA